MCDYISSHLLYMCGEDRWSAWVWVDVFCSATAVTFDLWPFTRLLFINTTNMFNWIWSFRSLFSRFITWLCPGGFSLDSSSIRNQIALVYHTANSSITLTQAGNDSVFACFLNKRVYGWHTLCERTTYGSYGLNYRVRHVDAQP